jgi:hypothetical protein
LVRCHRGCLPACRALYFGVLISGNVRSGFMILCTTDAPAGRRTHAQRAVQ